MSGFEGRHRLNGLEYECRKDGDLYKVTLNKGNVKGNFEFPVSLTSGYDNPLEVISYLVLGNDPEQSNLNPNKFSHGISHFV